MGAPRTGAGRPRVLFLVTEDWYFVSHRLALAEHVRAAGFEVVVGTRCGAAAAHIRAAGIALAEVPFERSLRHPLRDLRALVACIRLIRRVRPDVVHLVSLKPILLGASALALAAPRTPALWAFTGMGYLFTSEATLARCLRPLVTRLLALLHRPHRSAVVVQNEDDRALLASLHIADESLRVIAGAGVDLEAFRPREPLPAVPLVLLPARLLRDKGVGEFAAAAARIRATRPEVRCVLAGALDRDNHGAIERAELDDWLARGIVEWWGHCTDMAAVYNEATVVCLPSYREGYSKALLEAAACGRALVASDVPGCRELCRDGVTGRLVPARDDAALAEAVLDLIDHPARCADMGRAARELVEREHGVARVAGATVAVYRELIEAAGTDA